MYLQSCRCCSFYKQVWASPKIQRMTYVLLDQSSAFLSATSSSSELEDFAWNRIAILGGAIYLSVTPFVVCSGVVLLHYYIDQSFFTWLRFAVLLFPLQSCFVQRKRSTTLFYQSEEGEGRPTVLRGRWWLLSSLENLIVRLASFWCFIHFKTVVFCMIGDMSLSTQLMEIERIPQTFRFVNNFHFLFDNLDFNFQALRINSHSVERNVEKLEQDE